MNRKEFILAGTVAALMPKVFAAEKPCAENDWGVVPDDVRVTGFDDLAYAKGSRVPLTTVRQPCAELGLVALRTLVERILHRDLPPREILLAAKLIRRRSA